MHFDSGDSRMPFIGLLLIALGWPAFGHEGHQPLPTKGVQIDLKAGHLTLSRAARDVLDVQTADVRAGNVAGAVRAYATVTPPWTQHAYVTSRLPGRIAKLQIRPGDFVEVGQALAELDSLDLQTLRLDYQKAQIEFELSARILETVIPAAKAGSIAGQRLVEAENTHRQNQNALDVLRAKAQGLHVDEDELKSDAKRDSQPLRLPLKSPIRGIVVHADVAVGKFIEPTEHLFEIVDTSSVWVKIGVLERDLSRVQEGQSVRVKFIGLPSQAFDTKVDKLGLLLDVLTHQGTAWAEIKNEEQGFRLLPGMNGQAEFILPGRSSGVTVPTAAIFSDGAERYVFVEETSTKSSSEYRKKAIVIGRQTSTTTEVVSGDIFPGDRVVTRGGHELSSLFFLGVLRLSPETASGIGLRVEPAMLRSVEHTLAFDGAIDVPPQLRTSASSQLAGTLRAIRVDRGQAVKAGDVLAEIASLEVQDMQLELLKTHLDAVLWRDTYSRMRDAVEAVARRTVLELESRVQGLDSRSAILRQKLLTIGLTNDQIETVVQTRHVVDTVPVRAPIDGVVVHFDRVLGQVIRADEPLFEIHDLSQAWVQAFIGERDSVHVQVGQTARIRLIANPDFEAQGTVARLGPVIGVESRTQAAWIELQGQPTFRLQHNMLARVVLTTARPSPTLAVPHSAVVRDGLRSFVFVQKADGTFDRRRVDLGRSDDRFLEIKSGLIADERVATSGVLQLQTAYASLR